MASTPYSKHQPSLSDGNFEPTNSKKLDSSFTTKSSPWQKMKERRQRKKEKKQQEKEEKMRQKKIEADKKTTIKTKKTSFWSSCFGGLFTSRKTNDDEWDEYEETADGKIDESNVIVELKAPSDVFCSFSPDATTYDQPTSNQPMRQSPIVSETPGESAGTQESTDGCLLSPSALYQSISNQPIQQPSIVLEVPGEIVGILESTDFCPPSFSAPDENEMLRLQLEQKTKDFDELKSQMEQLKIYSNEQTYALEHIIAAHFGASEQNNKSAHEEEIRGLCSQLTMLQSLTLEQARQISSLEMLLLESRNENKYGCSYSLPRIYFERQREALCGMHAINNMLQGPVFNRRQMFSFAYEVQKIIDQCEPTTWRRRRSDDNKMFTYEGYFNIAVLEKALLSLDTGPLQLVPWYHPDQAEGRKDPANLHSALIVNVGNTHWVSWRKIRGKWFYFDSLNDEEIACPDDELLTVLNNGLRKNCSIYFVIGSLPDPL